ncbi:MAG: hypothetical protein ACREIF_13420 [Chthoniobacterales bacterium]
MHIPTLIERKRDGEELSPNEPLLWVDAPTDQSLASVLPMLEQGIELA